MMKEGFLTLGVETALIGCGAHVATNKDYINKKISICGIQTDPRIISTTIFGLVGIIHICQFTHSTIITHKSNQRNNFALTTNGNSLILKF